MAADSASVLAWREELGALQVRLGELFVRAEPRRQAGLYLEGLLSAAKRKNGWQLAEQIGDARPWRTQRVLSHVLWDQNAARDLCRDYVIEHLGAADGVLIVDETGFLKKGEHSVVVARQYSGTAGRIENAQIGVFLTYASGKGHALIDRELYIPQSWADYRDRCRAASIPDEVEFTTKPRQAQAMVGRAIEAGVPFAWFTADEAYGQAKYLRVWLEDQDVFHVLAIRCSDTLITASGSEQRADVLIAALPPRAWRRLSVGAGAHGPREYDWARIPVRICWRPGRGHWLLARRSISDPAEIAYYVCYGPRRSTLVDLAWIAGSRWHVEECFQQAKGEAGLDHYQVRSWRAWYAHITLSMLALAWLAASKARAVKGESAPATRA